MPGAGSGISNADLLDLTLTTLENLPKLEFEVALAYQEYPVCNQWFQREKVQIESGTAIKRNIILDTSGNARHVRLYQRTPINVADVHHAITAPWVQVQTHWSIERREMLRNRAPARFINLLEGRRVDATVDLADLLEEKAWSTPSSAADDLNPRGVPYWISHRQAAVVAGTDNGGFSAYTVWYSGGTSTTTKGGIDGNLAGNTKWKNWASVYTAINADFVKRLRRAFHACNFRSPIVAKDMKQGPAARFKLYMGLDELVEYEDLVTSANDNLGRDLDPFHGVTTFRRVPIQYTPQLDTFAIGDSATDTSPVYGINHQHFFPFVQDGDWMREEEPMVDVELHNVLTSFLDGSYQYFSKNVRAGGFCLHKTFAS